jgi:hypothetical protein
MHALDRCVLSLQDKTSCANLPSNFEISGPLNHTHGPLNHETFFYLGV